MKLTIPDPDPNFKGYDLYESGTFDPCGPGGHTTLIENNEKGILAAGVAEVPDSMPVRPSDHDSFKQGIYRV